MSFLKLLARDSLLTQIGENCLSRGFQRQELAGDDRHSPQRWGLRPAASQITATTTVIKGFNCSGSIEPTKKARMAATPIIRVQPAKSGSNDITKWCVPDSDFNSISKCESLGPFGPCVKFFRDSGSERPGFRLMNRHLTRFYTDFRRMRTVTLSSLNTAFHVSFGLMARISMTRSWNPRPVAR